MATQQKAQRIKELSAIDFVAGEKFTKRLPTDGKYTHIKVIVTVVVALSSGSGSGTVISSPISPLGILSDFKLVRSGDGYAPQTMPVTLQQLFCHQLANRPRGVAPKWTPIDSGTAATHTAFAEIDIPLSALGSRTRPVSMFDSRGQSTFQIEGQWAGPNAAGARDAIYDSNDRTADFTGTKVQIIAYDMSGAALYLPPEKGGDSKKEIPTAFQRADGTSRHNASGSGDQEEIYIRPFKAAADPTQRDQIRSINILAFDDSERDDDLIGAEKLELWLGGDLIREVSFSALQIENQQRYGIPAASWPTGFAVMHFDDDAEDFSRLLQQTEEGSQLILKWRTAVTPTNAAWIDVHTERYRMTPAGVAAARRVA